MKKYNWFRISILEAFIGFIVSVFDFDMGYYTGSHVSFSSYSVLKKIL